MPAKKRYIISSVISVLLLAFTKHYWMPQIPPPDAVSTNIDFLLIIIIAVFVFFAVLKITSYLASFKDIEKQSRIDIIFLFIFFIILFIPMSLISHQETKSKEENRKLAVYKPLFKKGKINYNFGKDFNSWFSDRFRLRKEIIKAYITFKYKITYIYFEVPKKAFINKKTKWCFRIDDYYLKIYKPIKKETIEKNADNLNKLNEFCIKNNIKLYVLVAPVKEDIYKEYSYPFIFNGKNNFYEVQKYIKDNYNINFIYTEEQIRMISKQEFVFFKTDHHWSDYGAYTGYRELVKEIKKDFPSYKCQTIDNFEISESKLIRSDFDRKFHIGNTAMSQLKLKDTNILDVKYKYFNHKDEENLKVEIDNKLMKKIYDYPASKNNLTAILLGNSMCDNLTDILPYDFKKLKRIRTNNEKVASNQELKMDRFENEIIEFKPDILILNINEAYINHLSDMYPEEKE